MIPLLYGQYLYTETSKSMVCLFTSDEVVGQKCTWDSSMPV